MKKRLILIFSLIAILCMGTLSSCASASKAEIKETPLYLLDLFEEDCLGVDLAFFDGINDIPYISMEDAKDIMISLFITIGENNYDLEYEVVDNVVVLTRENGFIATVDFDDNTIGFLDYDAFLRINDSKDLIDIVSFSGYNEYGEAHLFKRSDSSFEIYGNDVQFDLGKYEIEFKKSGNNFYIPFQTFGDVFLAPYNYFTLYNGESAFIAAGSIDEIALEYYTDNVPEERSYDLTKFTYDELCFVLDNYYGLKDQHEIDNFSDFFIKCNLSMDLTAADPQYFSQALADLCYQYFDDIHSSFGSRGYMSIYEPDTNYGPSWISSNLNDARNALAREKYYPDGPKPYEEVGNTAYITFDNFYASGMDYYEEDAAENLDDTISLMIYSLNQIKREGSPIENVVLDLSNNLGGHCDAAAFVIGTFLGDGSISVQNTLSGSMVTQNFQVDANLDREFDEEDNLMDYNLFCLISPTSFSCGNLVPSVFKESHIVTLIGQTTGGGACVIQNLSTADGNVFSISGPQRLAYTKNGAFYDIDQGVEPDFNIANPELLYDRQYMTNYINGLMGK
ncbi:MAG: S41 family peptidase [Parasporobacterium sp.]|nr:S41 family peptidase [Parasporobacterium sp.]